MFAIPIRILLVDDDAAFLYALSEGIHRHFEVSEETVEIITCQSATEAFRQVETSDFDVIISDIRMPVMDGLELLDIMRVWQPGTPVLLASSHEDYEVAVQALRGGAYDLLQKPIEWDHFMTSFKSAVQARQIDRMQKEIATQQSSVNSWTLLRGIKVLLVDDDRDGCEMQRMALQAYGANVTAVNSAEAALNVLKSLNPDVIVSDIRMPQTDGYDFMQEVRRQSSYSSGEVPAVALTAYARNEDRTRALNAGFQLQLTKPVKPATLALTIIGLLKGEGWR
ncbi:MAG: response regulator [Drouetiella hepatica Uher 2000/2452]|uniref:Response regulator n=1 Tax=Drouetiella hepatica Uher 2000/2452 TaxID=904376 RepID=A0A951QAQ3_9CYAN|nr:response regulator [Drouetiella hepatica Uher 2000/2452]